MQRPRLPRSPLPVAGLLLGALLLASAARAGEPASGTGAAGAPEGGRVVILGFDGADARTVRELMEKDPGRYPNFRKLAEQGTFAPLEVVVPAESPVSWASLNSGQNPAKTGVPGFIRRHMGTTPMPGFGHIEKNSAPLEQFGNTPIPVWSPNTMAAACGGGVFLVVLLLGFLAFRKLPVAAVLALVLGGGAAWGGRELRSFLPATYPRTTNVNQVESFWDVAARAGVECVVLDGAQTFDPVNPSGAKVLHGLGLPDARNELGNWFVYTTDPEEFAREGRDTTTAGKVYKVDVDGYDGLIHAKVYGPRNFWLEQQLQGELAGVKEQLSSPTLSLDESSALATKKSELDARLSQTLREPTSADLLVKVVGDAAEVSLGGRTQTLKVGQWSDWYELSFEFNWLLKVHAVTRARLVSVAPHFELFVDALDIDPRQPPFWQEVSTPYDFAVELAHDCGLYETYGWPTLTMPYKDEEIEPEVLLEDVEFTERWRERLTQDRLGRDDWRCLMSVFSTTDRVQHMTYQFYDAGHPLHKPEVAAREMDFFGERIRLSEAIPAIYRQMDRIIGDVLVDLRPEDTLLVVSDHGFQSFRRQVHLNNWLAEQGYLVTRPLTSKNRNALAFVDWSKTRAYALGVSGSIYVNLQGREPTGIVSRDDYRPLVDEIKQKLLEATDPDNGTRFCSEVYVPRDLHQGEFLALEGDLIPGFEPPYRVGWTTSLGGISASEVEGTYKARPVCTDNDSNWSGDHVSMALSDVAGVFFSNRKVRVPAEGVRALQIAPTALTLLGVPVPPEMDLPPLQFD